MLLPSSVPGAPFHYESVLCQSEKTGLLIKCGNKSRDSSPKGPKFKLCPCKGSIRTNGKKTLTKWYVKVRRVLD